MPRVIAISESDWFAMADALTRENGQPTVRSLATLAKAKFGVSPSFTTVKNILETWRGKVAEQETASEADAVASIVQRAVGPLYAELLKHSAAKYEPLVREFKAREVAAKQSEEGLRDLLHQKQIETSAYLQDINELKRRLIELQSIESNVRKELNDAKMHASHCELALAAAERRWAEGRGDYLARISALESHNSLLLQSRKEEEGRYATLVSTIQKVRGER